MLDHRTHGSNGGGTSAHPKEQPSSAGCHSGLLGGSFSIGEFRKTRPVLCPGDGTSKRQLLGKELGGDPCRPWPVALLALSAMRTRIDW